MEISVRGSGDSTTIEQPKAHPSDGRRNASELDAWVNSSASKPKSAPSSKPRTSLIWSA